MTRTLTTTIDVPTIGAGLTVEVDYTYSRRYQELVISAVVAKIEGKELPVWHLLSREARGRLEDECVTHYTDTVTAAEEQKWEESSGR